MTSLTLETHKKWRVVCVAKEEFVVLFSSNVYKWNRFGMKQERTIIVTNLNFYSFNKKRKQTRYNRSFCPFTFNSL